MFPERQKLITLCLSSLQQKSLSKDERYKDRLKRELKQIDAQGEHEYLLGLHEKFRTEKLIFPHNENNALVDWLLGLAPDFNIEEPFAFVQGESPDIDIDYLRDVRDYLKRTWAAKRFGREYICEIGTYGTLGIKSAILDMASVHGVDKHEIQAITVRMEDKDDEGKELEWDKALELYPDFKAYCEQYPDVANAARLLLNRNKSGGVHAGGLIISDQPIDGFVPLEVRMVNKKNPDGVICSAWTEGLNAQDLQPVGLIKFDLLVINNLMQIALACKLVKERHGLKSICAHEGSWDWSDISYLNDPLAIKMADKADLKCIFQFDSEGIRKLVKRGGVASFDDLVAYSAIYRPGPLNLGMDARYCKRKRWKEGDRDNGEPYSLHPMIEPILGRTYGVLIFQEQVMDMLRIVGNVPDMHTEKVRKAISKKKVKDFIKYKEMFIENGKKNLNTNAEFCIDLWKQIESFAEYGFNLSHSCAYAYISSRLLWLKAHYPLEFYTAILMCEEDADKFREYKLDAKNHNIRVNPVHINKSRANFHIEDDEIYFGFKKIKKIGEGVANRLEEEQPYSGFSDFLHRFGTDAAAVKALVALGCFKDEGRDRVTLLKFSEFYKEYARKRRDRQKRFELAMESRLQEIEELLLTEITREDPDWEVMHDFTEESEKKWEERFSNVMRDVNYKSKGETKTKQVSLAKLLQDVAKKRQTRLKNFHEDEQEDEENPITLNQFDPQAVELNEEDVQMLTDEMVVDGEKSYPKAESAYYGFPWTHLLETSPDFTGLTIDRMLDEVENKGLSRGTIEVIVLKDRERLSKKNVQFWSVDVEDANAKQMTINVWKDDHERWEDEFKVGNMLRIQVFPPSGGFNTLTFPSFSKRDRMRGAIPSKEEDARIIVMQKPEKSKPQEIDIDDFKFDESAIAGLEDLLS